MSLREHNATLATGAGPRVYRKVEVLALLGGIGETTYHRLIKPDAHGRVLLRSSRLYPGGPRVHTQQQWDEFNEYLNSEGCIAGQANLRLATGGDKRILSPRY